MGVGGRKGVDCGGSELGVLNNVKRAAKRAAKINLAEKSDARIQLSELGGGNVIRGRSGHGANKCLFESFYITH